MRYSKNPPVLVRRLQVHGGAKYRENEMWKCGEVVTFLRSRKWTTCCILCLFVGLGGILDPLLDIRCAIFKTSGLCVLFVETLRHANVVLDIPPVATPLPAKRFRWIDSSGWKLTITYTHQTRPKLLPKTWRFDLYQRPSSEEAGTHFLRFLTRREDAVSRKRSYAWLSW